MGILNVTPDSFSEGGAFFNLHQAVDHALRMAEEGADMIDVGGESTRPGAMPVSLEEESQRVIPVIEKLSSRLKIPISIDTTKSEVARRAIDVGAAIVNDVSGFTKDPLMFPVVAWGTAGLVIMHAKGTPQTMQRAPRYRNVIEEIYQFLGCRITQAMGHDIARKRIAIDPGIGFGKTATHNLTILHHLNRFLGLGLPVLVGPSRKSFIGKVLHLKPTERLEGTAAAAAIAIFQGAHIIRVHDVGPMKRVVQVAEAIRRGKV